MSATDFADADFAANQNAAADFAEVPLTSDETTWASLVHLSLFAGMIIPMSQWIIPLVIWFVWQEKSKFVAYHALQALVARLLVVVLLMVTAVLTIAIAVAVGVGVGASSQPEAGFFVAFFGWILLWIGLSLVVFLIDVIMAIYLAITAGQGQWSEYWPIGGLIKSWLPA